MVHLIFLNTCICTVYYTNMKNDVDFTLCYFLIKQICILKNTTTIILKYTNECSIKECYKNP